MSLARDAAHRRRRSALIAVVLVSIANVLVTFFWTDRPSAILFAQLILSACLLMTVFVVARKGRARVGPRAGRPGNGSAP